MDVIKWLQEFEPDVAVSIIALMLSVVSLVIAIVGVVLSIRNSNMQRAALNLAKNQENRKRSNIKVDLISPYGYLGKLKQIYDFRVSVLNQSDSDSSISDAELIIQYSHMGEILTMATRSIQAEENHSSDEFLIVPVDIAGRRAVSGVFRFEFPSAALAGKHVLNYKLCLTDTFNLCTEIQIDSVLSGGKI